MKRKILIMTVLLLAVTMLFAVKNTVKAAEVSKTEAVVEVKNSTETKYYDNLNEALTDTALSEKAIVTLLADINSTNIGANDEDGNHRVVIDSSKTLTFNFGNYTITQDSTLPESAAAFVVKGGAKVIFEGKGGITNSNIGGALLAKDHSTIILNGGTYITKGTRSSGYQYPAVTVLDSTVEVNDGAILKNENGSPALQLENTTATINGGTISQTGTPIDNKNYNTIQSSKGELTVKGGTITSETGSGIGLFGTNPKLTIIGGTITAKSFAVSGNGSTDEEKGTHDSTIIIEGGTLTSTGTAAIYHPQTGDLTIKKGTIKGYYGIVSRQGGIVIEGGDIIATGTEPKRVGSTSEDVKLPVGALVTDNVTSGYSTNTYVTVEDGNFTGDIATYGTPIHGEMALRGGTYDREIPTRYILNPYSLEVRKGNTYYLGKDAEEALINAESGDKLTVVNGDVELENIHNGVEVTNEGDGEVRLNGQKVKGTPVKIVNQEEQTEQELADLKSKLEKLEKDLNDEKINSENAKAELDNLKARVDSLEKENKDLKDRVAKLEEKVAKLEKAQQKDPEEEQQQAPTEKPPTEGEASEELDDEPKTGDTYAVSAGLVSLLSLAGAVVSKKFIK